MKKPKKFNFYYCPYGKLTNAPHGSSKSVGGFYCKNNCGLYKNNKCKVFKK